MKYILMMGGANYMHEAFKKEGYKVILLELANRKHKLDKSNYYEVHYFNLDDDLKAYLLVVDTIIDQYGQPLKIMSFNQLNQLLTAQISNHYGFEYHSIDLIETIYSKNVLREKLKDSPFGNVPAKLCHTMVEVSGFINEVGYPIVCKPIDGIAGVGVKIIYGADHYIQDVLNNQGGVYLEKYITGKEYSVEGFSYLGHHEILNITEKIKGEDSREIGHIVPAVHLSYAVSLKINAFIKQLFTYLGLQEGISHTEIIVNDEGVYLIETHLRPGGGLIGKLLENSYDTDQTKIYVDSMKQNRNTTKEIVWNGKYSVIYNFVPNQTGKIVSITDQNIVKDYDLITFKQPGDEVICGNIDNHQRIGAIKLSTTNPNGIIERCEDIVNNIRVDYKDE